MAKQGQISVSMSTDLTQAARDLRNQKQVQQELADALGLTRGEVVRLQRNLRKKEQADKTATVATGRHAAAQVGMARATQASRVATLGATQALSAMGIAANSALGPVGLVVAAVAAIGAVSIGSAGSMSAMVDANGLLAEGTGLSVRGMLAVRHAVATTGGDINKTKEALASFSRVMADDLAGKSAPEVDAALLSTIQRIEAISSPAERAAERMRVFGTRSAIALAGLTGANMADAASKTAGLADAIDGAAGASSKMDRASAELNTAMSELAVTFGERVAPSVIELTDGAAALVGAMNSLSDTAVGSYAAWVATGGAFGEAARQVGNLHKVITGTTDAQREHVQGLKRQELALRAAAQAGEDYEIAMESAFNLEGGVSAPTRREGVSKKDAAAARAAAQGRAKVVADATKAVHDKRRQDEFAAMVAENEERLRLAQEGATMLAELEMGEAAAADAAHARRLSQIEETARAEDNLRTIREGAALSAVTGFAQIAGAASASAEVVAVGRILETLAYGAAATGRAFAELGPIAGFGAAIAMAGNLAAQIAAVKSAPSRHMGSMAPDEGLLRVRNGERVSVEPATTTPRRERQDSGAMTLTIDNQAYRAMQRRSARQDSIFGSRRRAATEVTR